MRSFPFFSVMALTVCAVAACKKSAPQAAGGVPDFHKPADPAFAQQAPDSFRARLSTTQGDVVILVHRAWAPHGADRFYNLVRSGFYDGVRFFRVIPGFMAQFGIHGDPGVTAAWRPRTIPDDPVRAANGRGMVTYATAGALTPFMRLRLARNVARFDDAGTCSSLSRSIANASANFPARARRNAATSSVGSPKS